MTSSPQFAAGLLRASSRGLAKAILQELHERQPELCTVGLPSTFADPLEDVEVRLLQLAATIGVDCPALYGHMLAWYKIAFHHRNVPAAYLPATLDAMVNALLRELPAKAAALVEEHVREARVGLEDAPVDLPSHLSRSAPHGELAMRFLLANLEGRGEDAIAALRHALANGVPVAAIHDHVLLPAQREVGRMWLMAEIPIADEHYGSGVVDRALWFLQDHVPRPPADAPRIVTMGVGGNLHDFGLRLVAQRLQLFGFAVHHLGANMPASDVEWALQDRPVDLIALSATMAMHLHVLTDLVATLRRVTLRLYGRETPILVGGEPFRLVPDLFLRVGADASAEDAGAAVAAAQRLIGRRFSR